MASDPFASVTSAELLGGMYGPNQYSQFQGRMPFPGYVGTPTDALGRPITPGTTLNQTAAQPQAAAAPDASAANANRIWQAAQGAGQGQYMNALQNSGMAPWQQQGAGGQSAGQGQPASAPPGSLNTALAALGNPGPVTTPGATVPQSTVGSQPSVLQQFLANQKGGTGAANYSNQGFFNTLNALGGGQ